MAGTVTVFNSYNEPVTNLLVANNVAGNIAGWAAGPSPSKYTPSALSVARSKYPQTTPVFAYGDNRVVIPWNSYTGNTTISIPATTSVDDDLILYLTLNQAVLLTARGMVLSITPVSTSLSGQTNFEADQKAG